MNSASVDSTKPPMFPEDRSRFPEWRRRMLAYAGAQQLQSAFLKPPKTFGQVQVMDEQDFAEWMDECEERYERAKKKGADEDDVAFMNEHVKCKRAVNILFQALGPAQMALLDRVFQDNPHAMWLAIDKAYGVVNSADTVFSLYSQLNAMKKASNEGIQEYITRVDKVINQLTQLKATIDKRMRQYTILHGLSHLPQWSHSVTIFIKTHAQNGDDEQAVDTYLLNEENRQKVQAESKVKPEEAHVVHTVQNNRSRGGYRGRGGYQGRGGHQGGSMRGGRGGQRMMNSARSDDSNNNNNNKRGIDIDGRGKYAHIKCFECGKYGHFADKCHHNKRQKHTHAAHAAENDDASDEQYEEEGYSCIAADDVCGDIGDSDSVTVPVWILDSGATTHHTGDRSLLHNIRKLDKKQTTKTANGVSVYDEIGDARVNVGDRTVLLKDVVYVPDFSANLISVAKITEKGNLVSYANDKAVVMNKNNDVMFIVPKRGR